MIDIYLLTKRKKEYLYDKWIGLHVLTAEGKMKVGPRCTVIKF